jgi:hypothetical protein
MIAWFIQCTGVEAIEARIISWFLIINPVNTFNNSVMHLNHLDQN